MAVAPAAFQPGPDWRFDLVGQAPMATVPTASQAGPDWRFDLSGVAPEVRR